MRNFNVVFEVFGEDGNKELKTISVEAGTKKIATIRAMHEINKMSGYSEKYKNVKSIEEVA